MMKSTSSTITDFQFIQKENSDRRYFIFNHLLTGEVGFPYLSKVVADENFEEKPDVEGWQTINLTTGNGLTQTCLLYMAGLGKKKKISICVRRY